MEHILRLAAIFALIVYLLRRKHPIGMVMILASLGLAASYLMHPFHVMSTAGATALEPITLELLSALVLIRMLEVLLKKQDALVQMMGAFKRYFRSRRAVIVSMPLLIGMLPSVGGAYFSAPMVEEASRGMEMSADEKAFVNYWFRHPWELVLPMYPGILLASALTGMELRSIMLLNLPFAALMVGMGFLVSMRRLKGSLSGDNETGSLWSFLPIGAVLIMVTVFGIRLYIALAIVVAILTVTNKMRPAEILAMARHGAAPSVITLIFGIMLFKNTMGATGAVQGISEYFISSGVPLMPTLIAIPFAAGILTGITVGYVGATFPFLVSLPGGGSPEAIVLAFAAGFVGVLLSPTHVCLLLTREYFHASMLGIYKRMAAPAAVLMALGAALYFLIPLYF